MDLSRPSLRSHVKGFQNVRNGLIHFLTMDTNLDNDNFKAGELVMIRKLPSGKYRLYSRSKNPKTGKRRNLGTFETRAAAVQHEREVQFFKRRG